MANNSSSKAAPKVLVTGAEFVRAGGREGVREGKVGHTCFRSRRDNIEYFMPYKEIDRKETNESALPHK